jgi:hypothetical protein
MSKDGDEKRVEANLIFVYQEEDASVGIFGGWGIAGIEIGNDFISLEDLEVKRNYGSGEQTWYTYAVDPQDALRLSKLGEDLTESDQEEE